MWRNLQQLCDLGRFAEVQSAVARWMVCNIGQVAEATKPEETVLYPFLRELKRKYEALGYNEQIKWSR